MADAGHLRCRYAIRAYKVNAVFWWGCVLSWLLIPVRLFLCCLRRDEARCGAGRTRAAVVDGIDPDVAPDLFNRSILSVLSALRFLRIPFRFFSCFFSQKVELFPVAVPMDGGR